jgi:predicted dithiol-disulfide oxidoreductase (DUF899 family)
MLGPDLDTGCEGCSLVSDHFDGGMVHLNQRDVTMVCVSGAPLAKLDQLLDRAPKGRDEEALLRDEGEWWWRCHDEYGDGSGGGHG